MRCETCGEVMVAPVGSSRPHCPACEEVVEEVEQDEEYDELDFGD